MGVLSSDALPFSQSLETRRGRPTGGSSCFSRTHALTRGRYRRSTLALDRSPAVLAWLVAFVAGAERHHAGDQRQHSPLSESHSRFSFRNDFRCCADRSGYCRARSPGVARGWLQLVEALVGSKAPARRGGATGRWFQLIRLIVRAMPPRRRRYVDSALANRSSIERQPRSACAASWAGMSSTIQPCAAG